MDKSAVVITKKGNRIKPSKSYQVFYVFNTLMLTLLAAICLFPLLNVLAMSFSSAIAISRGEVGIWPVNFTTLAYEHLATRAEFWNAILNSVKRCLLGWAVNLTLVILVAYPLSKPNSVFPSRTRYVFYFFFTMLFGGGLIPTFLVVRNTGLTDTLWALILPGGVQVYNVILMLNFFRQLPREMEEAAFMDGAGHITNLVRIVLPCSLASLATISLFILVGHWNEWFSPIIYMRSHSKYPLQTYLRSMLNTTNFQVNTLGDLETIKHLSNKNLSSAQIFLGMIPILCVYPFLQKYFAKGIVLGSVKG